MPAPRACSLARLRWSLRLRLLLLSPYKKISFGVASALALSTLLPQSDHGRSHRRSSKVN